MRRRLVTAAVVLLACAAIAAGAVYGYLRRSLPQIDGEASVDGLASSIDIIRDADAIPHIFASTRPDALFGLGYVHAQDRLWQMELQRRIGNGRLSEIFGPATLAQDRFLRTVGFGRAARATWDQLSPDAKALVGAYVAGVNAFIATHHGGMLPPEFTILRFEPEPWTGADVVVWQKMLAWDLCANYSFELLRDDLIRTVGFDRMQQLMPPYPQDGLTILATGPPIAQRARVEERSSPTFKGKRPEGFSTAFARALSGGLPQVSDLLLRTASDGFGSNSWVVDGSLTATGLPLIANDPHLGTRVPSTWYLAHLSAGEFDVIGATLPGTPAITLGRNRFIAWAATNALIDVEDLYRERLDADGRHAEFRGASEPLTIAPEAIVVKGAPTVQVDVRISRHGPIVTDAINVGAPGRRPAPLDPLAFRWTGLDADDTTLAAMLDLNVARDWSGFTAALRQFIAPSQNFLYADTSGHIGYYTPGRAPIRAEGDGAQPVDGWTGDHEWTGFIPFEEMPHVFDPPEHFLVTANHRQAPAAYPFYIGMDWQEPLRAERITELLRAGEHFTPDDFARMQADTVSVQARTLLPLFLSHATPTSPGGRQAVSILRAWDLNARGESVAAAIFAAWLQHLVPAMTADDVGPGLITNYQERFSSVTRFLERTLGSDAAAWCDNVMTARVESCSDTVTLALDAALADVGGRLGGDLATWRWDRLHKAVFAHQGLDSVAMLRPLLSRSAPNGGDWSSINIGTPSVSQPYDQRSVAGYRSIVDLSPADDSRFLIDVGQSGHVLSRRYDDFLEDWSAVRHKKMRREKKEIEAGAIGHLRLKPRGT